MPGKKIGLGSQISVAATTVAAQTVIGGLLSLDGPNMSKAIVDITTIDASTAAFVEKYGGYRDGGTVTIELAFYSTDDAGQTALETAYQASTCYAFQLYSGSTTDSPYHFKALVQDIGRSIPGRDEMLTRSVTLAVTGKPTGSTGG